MKILIFKYVLYVISEINIHIHYTYTYIYIIIRQNSLDKMRNNFYNEITISVIVT